ncbi:MAG: hypothetical protein LBN20_02410 [Endomicrobium sp.]|jgi:hypothetical protein|nr:hypothetical protein [Endomicrobium sp.]
MESIYSLWDGMLFGEDELLQMGIYGEEGLIEEGIPYLKLENFCAPQTSAKTKQK